MRTMDGTTMQVVVGDDLVAEPAPRHWTQQLLLEVDDRPVRLALAEVAAPGFTASADYNRDHVLVRVRAFTLKDRDQSALYDDGRSVIDGTRGFGSDFVGEVVACGSDVSTLGVGDRVLPCASWPPADPLLSNGLVTSTASRQYLRLPAQHLLRVPDSMVDEQAAAAPSLGQTMFAMLRRLAVRPGEQVLVCPPPSATGAEMISLLSGRGVEVSAMTTSSRQVEALQRLGAVQVYELDREGLKALTGYARGIDGFDVVVDLDPDTYFATAVALMGFDARYITPGPGVAAGAGSGQWSPAGQSLVSKNATVFGQHLGTRADLQAAIDAWVAGEWQPIIDSTFGPDDLNGFAHRQFTDPDRLGKVVFSFPNER